MTTDQKDQQNINLRINGPLQLKIPSEFVNKIVSAINLTPNFNWTISDWVNSSISIYNYMFVCNFVVVR